MAQAPGDGAHRAAVLQKHCIWLHLLVYVVGCGSCVLRCGSNKQEAGSSKWYEFAAKGKVRWAKERGGIQHLGRRRLKRELGGPLNAKLSVVGVCFPFNADLSGGALTVQFRRQGSRA
ncbi:hypothetical protein CSPX01_07817 [Colletotrichum filicis]|nr:hypothetical protein CSPX01_07817 [Colletotrichum filicis]